MVPLDPVPQPIDHLLRGRAEDVALVDRDGALTFAELEIMTGQVAAWLAARGLAPGGRVASWLPKTRLACVLPLAAPRAGLVHVPINPVLKRAQVAHILDNGGATLLITQESRAATLQAGDLPNACRVALESEAEGTDTLPPSGASPDALAALLYTSGSTGRPKGVMLSHANLWLGAVCVAHYLRLGPMDRVLAVLPLAFDYGQNQLLSAWLAGASVVPLDYALPGDVVRAVARFGANTLAGVPPLWAQVLDTPWPEETAACLVRLTNSGGALTPGLVHRLRQRFGGAAIHAMYGLTEAFRSTSLPPELIDTHPESIGRAVPFAEVMVVDAEGRRCAAGQEGELVHAGPLVSGGYWRDPGRTAERFRPAPAWSASGGMSVWSGDRVIADEDGLLRFVGRGDEMLKVSGYRVSPGEVEEAVLAGGEVREAVAVGVPDEATGQAIVVIAAGNGTAEADLRARLRRDLPTYLQPVRYEWRETLPRTANGKLDRAALRTGLGA
ncbi:AMP-binding protein [Sphingomonas aracearum]|uniref:AMP-binding protein n=1 Tax=Sphingomonas aracearum TaxID=2283317 RepID=A0A369VWT1_9SPHN|nr:AMP-binding protein [Sphingomonas aracearum]RDE06583.1 AMP-binding protein [Sphingomonas aracearum]